MSPSSQPLVHVVILSWNGRDDTLACVESCLRATYPNLRVLVVDNGSTDGSPAAVRERFPAAEVLELGENLGYTGGNNAGIRHALAAGADHVLLLNNDTIVDPGFVEPLVEEAGRDPSIGMLNSKMYFFDEPDRIWFAGASFHPWLGWGRHHGYGDLDRGQFDRPEWLERATGCSLLVTRALCARVGLLSDGYFAYCEDLDWSVRARKAGFKIRYVPASRIWHKVSRSTGGTGSGVSHYYFTRNMLRCLDANWPVARPFRPVRWSAVVATSLLGVLTQRVPWRRGGANVLRGAWDYLRGRQGRWTPPAT
jgi:GT2 family glycosyltransferase